MAADLPLYLNLDEEILAARRVLGPAQLLMRDLPTLVAGMTYSAELRLLDGQGAPRPESGAVGYEPQLLITAPGIGGGPPRLLVEIPFASLTVITETVPVGWSFVLPLTSDELGDYLGASQSDLPVTVEIYMETVAGLKALYARETTIRPGSFSPAY